MGSSTTRFLPVPPDDAEEVLESTNFTRGEIDYLYRRFLQLNVVSGNVRFLYKSDIHITRNILHATIVNAMFENKRRITFVDFATFLGIFRCVDENAIATSASNIRKMNLLFSMYDMNKDGNINKEDLMDIVFKLYSNYMDIKRMAELVNVAMSEMDESGADKILFDDFCRAMDIFDMDLIAIKFPTL